MRNALFAAALAAILTTLPGPVLAQLGAAPRPVRAMSYNIRVDVAEDRPNWETRRPHMAAQIAFLDPDLLGFQEARRRMVEWLAGELPAYDRYGVGRDDGGPDGESTTLFWKRERFAAVSTQTLWCSPTPTVPSKGWDAAYPRTVTRVVLRDRVDGALWDIRNTHFDHVGQEARRQCAELVADLAPAEGAHVVLMGDFNTGTGTAPYRTLVASGLRDARAVSPVVFGPEGTFNGFDLSKTDGEAIDHLFVGPGLDVLRFAVPTDSFQGLVISDHFPLVADIAPTSTPAD